MPIDFNKFKEAFLSEAAVHIRRVNKSLLELEKNPDQAGLLQEITRSIHTLKSLSGTMDYIQSMQLCHAVEDLLSAIRSNKLHLQDSVDILFKCFDYLNSNIKYLSTHDKELEADSILYDLKNFLSAESGSININDVPSASIEMPALEKIQSIEVKVKRLDVLMNLAEELLITKMKLDSLEDSFTHPELVSAVESFGRLLTELQYHVMQIRLVPVSFVFNRFSRMVRDLAKQEKKVVNLQVEGEGIEFDRLLIDEIGESLVHLVKNAIDHGLELPKVRQALGKPSAGTITLRASRINEAAMIEVSDDGAGLDLNYIKKIAIKKGFLKQNASDEDVLEAIFSNLTTKNNVTSISGRGLGLGIVRQKIESIGGSVRVKTKLGQGTTFFIEIPLSLAIIKTLFVKVAGKIYAIPLEVVKRLLVVSKEDFKGLLQNEAIIFDGEDIPIVRLSQLFGEKSIHSDKQSVVIIRKGEQQWGLVVDSLLSTQEVVVKPLGRFVKNNKYFSGAALIGSGQMVLIIDVSHLLPTKISHHKIVV